MTAANRGTNVSALDNPRELIVSSVVPAAAISSSTAPVFSRSDQRVGSTTPSAKPVGPCCGYEDDPCELACGAPATVSDIETGCTFCASHFREVIL